jgi:oligopeptide/dipeptide ABC transporter ATP-binding protein
MTEETLKAENACLLEVEDLVKTYTVRRGIMRRENITAVEGVSFNVEYGETLALVGESGCGKSTIGKCILGLVKIDQGTIRFQDQEIQDLSGTEFKPFRKHIQMVFQDPLSSFNPMMKISRTLMDPLRLRDDLTKADRYAEIIKLLDDVRLDHNYASLYPRQMSGGQLQRVGIARAIASQPELVFLDEPTSALDMSIRGQIVNLLLDLQRDRNLSYVLVTHDLRLVLSMADRVVMMYLGEIVEEGRADEIFRQPLHPYTQGLLSAALLGEEIERQQGDEVQLQGEVIALAADYVGCKLYKRCPFALDRCAEEPQELREVMPGRRVRCWRALDIQRKVTDQSLEQYA